MSHLFEESGPRVSRRSWPTKGTFTYPVSECDFHIALRFPINYLSFAQSR
jgi:hypothetical protein